MMPNPPGQVADTGVPRPVAGCLRPPTGARSAHRAPGGVGPGHPAGVQVGGPAPAPAGRAPRPAPGHPAAPPAGPAAGRRRCAAGSARGRRRAAGRDGVRRDPAQRGGHGDRDPRPRAAAGAAQRPQRCAGPRAARRRRRRPPSPRRAAGSRRRTRPAEVREAEVDTQCRGFPRPTRSPRHSHASSWSGIQSPVKTTVSHSTRAGRARCARSVSSTTSTRPRPQMRLTAVRGEDGDAVPRYSSQAQRVVALSRAAPR